MPGGLSLSQRLTRPDGLPTAARATRRRGADGRRGRRAATPPAPTAPRRPRRLARRPVAISRLAGDLPIATPEPRPALRAARGAPGHPRPERRRARRPAPRAACAHGGADPGRHARSERAARGRACADAARPPPVAPAPPAPAPPAPRTPRAPRAHADRDLRLERLMSAPAHLPDDRPRGGCPAGRPCPRRSSRAPCCWSCSPASRAGSAAPRRLPPRRLRPRAPPRSTSVRSRSSRPAALDDRAKPVAGLPGPRRPHARPSPRCPASRARAGDRRRALRRPHARRRRRCARSPPRAASRATLAGLPAWSYRPTTLSRGRIAQLTVAPTTAGALAVVCVAPAAPGPAPPTAPKSSRPPRCAARPRSSRARRSPSAASCTPVLSHLGARRAELRGRLRAAETRRGQARFAKRLARANGRAATALAPRAASARDAPGRARVARRPRRLPAARPRRPARLARALQARGRPCAATTGRWPGPSRGFAEGRGRQRRWVGRRGGRRGRDSRRPATRSRWLLLSTSQRDGVAGARTR